MKQKDNLQYEDDLNKKLKPGLERWKARIMYLQNVLARWTI